MVAMTRILIVEDSPDILFILKTELEWQGFVVDLSVDAAAALELLQDCKPDVIVSDVQMPGMNGLELIRQVRQMPDLKTVPAIALSGSSMPMDVQQAIFAGFTLHLTKPVELAQLIAAIEKLTEKTIQQKAG